MHVLICDDSMMARKQILRALPEELLADVAQACDGAQAMEHLRSHNTDLLLLDLTMPEMDGYQVLDAMLKEDMDTPVIVVSGDIQEQAQERVLSLGALAFLKKPVASELLLETLGTITRRKHEQQRPGVEIESGPVTFRDAFREVTNVAMGRAASLLAQIIGEFIRLPVPQINLLDAGELQMALTAAQHDAEVSAVCQGYISPGIAGEALLLFHDTSLDNISSLLPVRGNNIIEPEVEVLMDVAGILIGACLKGISEQLDIHFTVGHPVVLGRHCNIAELIANTRARGRRTMAVEICYTIESHMVSFDLLLLFTEDSVKVLQDKVGLYASI